MDYQAHYDKLAEALRDSHWEQARLVEVTEIAYAYLDEAGPMLSDQEVLGLRFLLAEAERQIGLYFGA